MPRPKVAYREFCLALDKGLPSSVIAAELGISRATVNRYVRERVLTMTAQGKSPAEISVKIHRHIDQIERILLSSRYQGRLPL